MKCKSKNTKECEQYMLVKKTKIPGCFELYPEIKSDERGSFIKIFNNELFTSLGLSTECRESYYTTSYKNVLRGLHFQKPPFDHSKLVFCISGEVLDVIVDLRVGSPTYKQFEVFDLSSEKANGIYLETGLAHGFYVKSSKATLLYNVSTVYSSEHDSGVLWNSIGFEWPNANPILSTRDMSFKALEDFYSPFIYKNSK